MPKTNFNNKVEQFELKNGAHFSKIGFDEITLSDGKNCSNHETEVFYRSRELETFQDNILCAH